MKIQKYLIFIFISLFMLSSFIIPIPSQTAAITSDELYFLGTGSDISASQDCSKFTLDIWMSVTGTILDSDAGGRDVDYFGIAHLNGDRSVLYPPASAIIDVGLTYTGPNTITVTGLQSRPFILQLHDYHNDNSVDVIAEISIDPATIIPACSALPYYTPSSNNDESARGITRVFDDGIVVARQPNGDYHFYAYDGCFIGGVTGQFLDDVIFPDNEENLIAIDGCGYTVNIDATGKPACSIVLNMYGFNGFYRTHWLEEEFESTATCLDDVNNNQ